jgi:hypothetical protein
VALTQAPIGYNQLSVALDLIEGPARLAALPPIPAPLKVRLCFYFFYFYFYF